MNEIIERINNELESGQSPNYLLLKTIKNEEPMCFFLVEYLLSKGADCYANALYEASKHNNINVINLMLPRTHDKEHLHAYLSACLEGNSTTRYIIWKNINTPVASCLYTMIKTGGTKIFGKVMIITEEIITYHKPQIPGRLRGFLYTYIAQGAIVSNNIEILDKILSSVPYCYHQFLVEIAKDIKEVNEKTLNYIIKNEHKMFGYKTNSCTIS